MPKQLILSGNVQGVFCRDFCRQNAIKLGLKGSASNLWDGTVQVLLDTEDAEKVNAFIHAIQKNPFGFRFYGQISHIEIEPYTGSLYGDYQF